MRLQTFLSPKWPKVTRVTLGGKSLSNYIFHKEIFLQYKKTFTGRK